jgi:hypothetical protein
MLLRRAIALAAFFFAISGIASAAPVADVRNFEVVNVRLGMTLQQVTAALASRGFTYQPMIHGVWPRLLERQYSYNHRDCISESTDTANQRPAEGSSQLLGLSVRGFRT